MAIPAAAYKIDQEIDPFNVLEVDLPISTTVGPAGQPPHLEGGEQIAWFRVARTPEAIASGVVILDGSWSNGFTYPGPTLLQTAGGPVIRVWLGIDPLMQNSPIFDSKQEFSLELSTRSDHVPPRDKQKTVAGVIKNQ